MGVCMLTQKLIKHTIFFTFPSTSCGTIREKQVLIWTSPASGLFCGENPTRISKRHGDGDGDGDGGSAGGGRCISLSDVVLGPDPKLNGSAGLATRRQLTGSRLQPRSHPRLDRPKPPLHRRRRHLPDMHPPLTLLRPPARVRDRHVQPQEPGTRAQHARRCERSAPGMPPAYIGQERPSRTA